MQLIQQLKLPFFIILIINFWIKLYQLREYVFISVFDIWIFKKNLVFTRKFCFQIQKLMVQKREVFVSLLRNLHGINLFLNFMDVHTSYFVY